MSKEAIEHYEAALKEAFPSGATGDVFHHWNEARKALAEQPAPMIRGDIRDGLVDDEPAHQHIEHCLWARNGNQPCPHVQPAQQQELVAWMHEWEDGERIPMLTGRDDRNNDQPKSVRPLVYGDTPQAQRKPLTLGQKQRLWSSVGDKPTLKDRVNAYGTAIEAAHGITKGGAA